MIGAGGLARATLLPALADGKATLVSVADSLGLAAHDVARRFGLARAASSPAELIEDETLDTVVITTLLSGHAALAAKALRHGKAVFVEKPLALDEEELALVRAAASPKSILIVRFNRRFAPLVKPLLSALEGVEDCVISVRVNAGPLPDDHWLHDPAEGGHRLLGEGCHFVDLLTHLAGSPVLSVHAVAFPQPDRSAGNTAQRAQRAQSRMTTIPTTRYFDDRAGVRTARAIERSGIRVRMTVVKRDNTDSKQGYRR